MLLSLSFSLRARVTNVVELTNASQGPTPELNLRWPHLVLNVAVDRGENIRAEVFFVSLFGRLLSQHLCISLFVAIVALSSPIYPSQGVCVWHTDSLNRTNLSFSLSTLFPPRFPSLDPANDSWKNNSENERATTTGKMGSDWECERKGDGWIWLRSEKNDTLAMVNVVEE